MVNLLGFESSTSDYSLVRSQLEAIPGVTVHWYGKKESRSGRKLGHVTVCLESIDDENMDAMIREIEDLWYPSASSSEVYSQQTR